MISISLIDNLRPQLSTQAPLSLDNDTQVNHRPQLSTQAPLSLENDTQVNHRSQLSSHAPLSLDNDTHVNHRPQMSTQAPLSLDNDTQVDHVLNISRSGIISQYHTEMVEQMLDRNISVMVKTNNNVSIVNKYKFLDNIYNLNISKAGNFSHFHTYNTEQEEIVDRKTSTVSISHTLDQVVMKAALDIIKYRNSSYIKSEQIVTQCPQEVRLKQVGQTCERKHGTTFYNHLLNNITTQKYVHEKLSSVLFDDKHKIMFCSSAKVGSTTFKHMFIYNSDKYIEKYGTEQVRGNYNILKRTLHIYNS